MSHEVRCRIVTTLLVLRAFHRIKLPSYVRQTKENNIERCKMEQSETNRKSETASSGVRFDRWANTRARAGTKRRLIKTKRVLLIGFFVFLATTATTSTKGTCEAVKMYLLPVAAHCSA